MAGIYEVTAEASGFHRLEREAIIEASSTTTVNLTMQVGATTDTVTVDAATPQMHNDSHTVGGVVRLHKEVFATSICKECHVVQIEDDTGLPLKSEQVLQPRHMFPVHFSPKDEHN